MSPCLVQQLFRQKVGKELDPSLIDDVLFPLLRPKKHPSKELLQDIKMTQSCNENGHSSIVRLFYGGKIQNTSLFGSLWLRPPNNPPYILAAEKRFRCGKNSSKFRRKTSFHTSWGSVDIMNELRESKTRYMIQFEKGGKGMSISLDEEPLNAARSPALFPKPKLENELVEELIEQSLLPGKRLSWGGDPDRLFLPILSNCY